MIKKLVIAAAISAAVLLGAFLQALVSLKNQGDPFDVWDEVDEYDLEQAVIEWENERYEEDLKDMEEND